MREEGDLEVRALAMEIARGLQRDVDDVMKWLTGRDPMEQRRLAGLMRRQRSVKEWRDGAKRARKLIDAGLL